ncbi:hypothetical protein [Micromonospora sp. NPDC049151]|uniref:hypothetical protein n=1 Tax=unclassified Micromonospora TaxID=2617518 RepID=UPI003407C885
MLLRCDRSLVGGERALPGARRGRRGFRLGLVDRLLTVSGGGPFGGGRTRRSRRSPWSGLVCRRRIRAAASSLRGGLLAGRTRIGR